MRYPENHKEETRARILRAANEEFKSKGFAGAGVQAVMKAAGLTHGGFYAHFKNKDELVRASLRDAFAQLDRMWTERLAGLEGRDWLEGWLTHYLSADHCAHPERGCPAAALAAEVARGDAQTRTVFTEEANRWADTVVQHIDGMRTSRKQHALAALSLIVGAMTIARATEEPLREQILESARSAVRSLLGLNSDGLNSDGLNSGGMNSDDKNPEESKGR